MATLPSTHQSTGFGESQQIDQTAQAAIRSINFLDPLFAKHAPAAKVPKQPKASWSHQTAGLFHDTYVDVEPTISNRTWGQEVQIALGNEGHFLITGIEIHFSLEALDNSLVAVGQRRFVYPRYRGELLTRGNGNDSDVVIRYMKETVARQFVDAEHMWHRLNSDIGSVADSTYLDQVGSAPTEFANTCVLPIEIPGIHSKNPLNSLQLTHPIILSFRLPRWQDFVTTDNSNPLLTAVGPEDPGNGLATAPAAPTIFMRVYYSDMKQVDRVLHTRQIVGQGLIHKNYAFSQLTQAVNSTNNSSLVAASGATELSFAVDLSVFLGPSACLFFGIRDALDLEPMSAYAGGAIALNSTANPSPQVYRFLPWTRWTLGERSSLQRVYPTQYYRANSSYHAGKHGGIGLNSAPVQQNIGVVSHTPHVAQSKEHSLGHVTYANMHKPTLTIYWTKAAYTSDANTTALASSDRIESDFDPATVNTSAAYAGVDRSYYITVCSMEHNALYQAGGVIRRNHNS